MFKTSLDSFYYPCATDTLPTNAEFGILKIKRCDSAFNYIRLVFNCVDTKAIDNRPSAEYDSCLHACLLIHSMEESPSSEANRFAASQ